MLRVIVIKISANSLETVYVCYRIESYPTIPEWEILAQ
jgi:hypothetical protein